MSLPEPGRRRQAEALQFEVKSDEASLPATCATRTVVLFSIALALAFLAEIIVLIVFPKSPDNNADNLEPDDLGERAVNIIAFQSTPDFVLALVATALAVGVLGNSCTGCGLFKKSREISMAAFWVSFASLLVSSTCFIILQLKGNGIEVIEPENSFALLQDFNPFEVSLETLGIGPVEAVVDLSQEGLNEWLQVQALFNDCCGLNFASTYAAEIFQIDNFDLDALLSSNQCAIARDEIDAIKVQFPILSEEALAAAEEDPNLSSEDFFCEPALTRELRSKAQTAAVLFGVQAFMQAVHVAFLAQLIWSYQEKEGGLKPDEDALEFRARAENTVLAQAGFKPAVASLPRQSQSNPRVRF